MCYEKMAEVWQDSKIDALGSLNPQEIMEELTKSPARGVESLGAKWNLPWVEEFGHHARTEPVDAIAKASTAVGAAYAGGAVGGLMGGSGGAASTAPAGLEGTMEAALANTGYTPSSLMNALQYGPGSGQGMGETMANYGAGLMNRAASPGVRQAAGRRLLMNSAMDMMQPPQQPPPPPPPPKYQPQPTMPIYMTEEERRRLMMMQRGIY